MTFLQVKGKKGSPTGMLWIIIIAAVSFVGVFLIMQSLFPGIWTFGGIAKAHLADPDNDAVRGLADKCPCTSGLLVDEGCPPGINDEQKKVELAKFNSDTGCGTLEVGDSEAKKANSKSEEAKETETPDEEFKHYRSIEFFADASDEDPRDEILWQACANWVGRECPTRDDDCDEDNFNFQSLTKGCWVMAVEDDGIDDCGQAVADEGTILSLHKFSNLKVDLTNSYQSIDDEPDPKILFSWQWKSKPEYGSLLCKEGFWYGCKGQEGNDLTVGSQTYTCTGSEWVKS